jgi:hypothetical protein
MGFPSYDLLLQPEMADNCNCHVGDNEMTCSLYSYVCASLPSACKSKAQRDAPP